MTTTKKIALAQAEAIPFDKLVLSPRNVRRIQADLSIAEFAEDIGQRGLLQSLSVRPVAGEDGAPSGKYEGRATSGANYFASACHHALSRAYITLTLRGCGPM